MYAFFATDNYVYPTPGPTKNDIGMSTRSVLAVSEDDGKTFHYLYDFSKGPDMKFLNVEIAHGDNGYLYFWGTQGGKLYRKSAPYFARKRAATIDQSGGMEYYAGLGADGKPRFTASESDAVPLFHDTVPSAAGQSRVSDCMGELGVEWNQFIKRWVMLHNCFNPAPANLDWIYMRVAEQPWGPWSEPQTIFNPVRDGGFCHFIHRPVTAAFPPCDNLNEPSEADMSGSAYGPYFISRFTNGDEVRGTSTFYYTISTWEPYQKIILKSMYDTDLALRNLAQGMDESHKCKSKQGIAL